MSAVPAPEEFEMLLGQTLVPDSAVIKQVRAASPRLGNSTRLSQLSRVMLHRRRRR